MQHWLVGCIVVVLNNKAKKGRKALFTYFFTLTMTKEDDDCNTYEFQRGLQLTIRKYGNNAIEFELKNRLYSHQRYEKLKQLFALSSLFFVYCFMSNLAVHTGIRQLQRSWIVDLGFLLYLVYLIVSLCRLIKKEKLLYCTDFAIQAETERFMSRRSNIFISAKNIHDVRINEVIEKIEVHYMLIVRTKDSMFIKRPIIPLFNALRPSVECLEIIYKYLNKLFLK